MDIPQENEVDQVILQILFEQEGQEAVDFQKKAWQDDNWLRVLKAGFGGRLAQSIMERFEKQDFDYTTPEGAVISNVFFPMQGTTWTHVIRPSDKGAKDLPLSKISQVRQWRPKLPGKMLTREQAIQRGIQTCYDLVELVGDLAYGITEEQQCFCCLFNKWQEGPIELEPWHEGVIVLVEGIEYRVKRHPTGDRVQGTFLWEMFYQEGWHPIRPREIGKHVQTDDRILSQVTLSMISPQTSFDQTGKQVMSKVYVEGQRGPVLVNQNGIWDMVGGKQQLQDQSPMEVARREYTEELGVVPPDLTFVGKVNLEHFQLYLYYVIDSRVVGGQDPNCLTGVQKKTWDEFFRRSEGSLFAPVSSKGFRSLEYFPFPVLRSYSDGTRFYKYELSMPGIVTFEDYVKARGLRFSLKEYYSTKVGSAFFEHKSQDMRHMKLMIMYAEMLGMKLEIRGSLVRAWSPVQKIWNYKEKTDLQPATQWKPVFLDYEDFDSCSLFDLAYEFVQTGQDFCSENIKKWLTGKNTGWGPEDLLQLAGDMTIFSPQATESLLNLKLI